MTKAFKHLAVDYDFNTVEKTANALNRSNTYAVARIKDPSLLSIKDISTICLLKGVSIDEAVKLVKDILEDINERIGL